MVQDRTGPAWSRPDRGSSVLSSVLSFPIFGLRARWPAAAAMRRFPSRLLLPWLLAALLDRLLLAFFSLTRAHLLSSALLLLLNPDLLSVFVQLVELYVTRANFTNLWFAVLIRNCLRFVTIALIFLVPNVNQSDAVVPPDILGSKSSSKSDAD
ncbi:hypothetical protein Cgig2_006305 [Carnegiea gigantea]|uniref:Uncharacterized protein n=1 Tax=Carnegiea gigantea TaxID=171969 RepID=A0A9Q1QDQ1_9CARY|nr:hypothetical protein Cgig2_006305 [Carnegiea gigantea]